jgi:predicted DNA-binding protein
MLPPPRTPCGRTPARCTPRRPPTGPASPDRIQAKRVRLGQITARVPDEPVEALDAAAERFKRSRAGIVRQALERYPEDYDDLDVALALTGRSGHGLATYGPCCSTYPLGL